MSRHCRVSHAKCRDALAEGLEQWQLMTHRQHTYPTLLIIQGSLSRLSVAFVVGAAQHLAKVAHIGRLRKRLDTKVGEIAAQRQDGELKQAPGNWPRLRPRGHRWPRRVGL
jgi:hypothetical protein